MYKINKQQGYIYNKWLYTTYIANKDIYTTNGYIQHIQPMFYNKFKWSIIH